MKWMFGKAAVWMWVIVASAAIASAAGPAQQPTQDIVLPDGAGKDLLQGACTSCHNLNALAEKRMAREGWQSLVASMVALGATLERDQVTQVVDYLAKNFALAGQEGSEPGAQDTAAADAAGLKIVQGACAGCHDAGLITTQIKDRAGWQANIENMIGKGATVTAAEVPVLLEYLVRHYSPDAKAAPAADTAAADAQGLKIMQAACTGCHDAGLITTQMKDRAGWQANIESMIGKGAPVNNEEKAILLEYLVRKYAPPAE